MVIKPVKTLAVDRSKLFLTHINHLLRKIGFTKIILADDGIEALKLLNIWTPDIILLDESVPGINKLSALDHIKRDKHTSHIPVILVFGEHDGTEADDYKSIGAEGALTKPVDAVALHECMQECLSSRGANRRKCVRTSFRHKVAVSHNGTTDIMYASNLSEGGIYISSNNPPPVNSNIQVTIPSTDDKPILLEGQVIYTKSHDGNLFSTPPGMAVGFTHEDRQDTIALRDYINSLISD